MFVRLTTSFLLLALPLLARAQTSAAVAQAAAPAAAAAQSAGQTAAAAAAQIAAQAAIQATKTGTTVSQPGAAVIVTPIDPTIIVVTAPAATGETSLTLDVGFGIRYVPASRVTVPVGENLRVTAPPLNGAIQWRKNGKPIAGQTGATLQLNPVQASDAGNYDAISTDPTMAERGSQVLILGVGPTNRLLNLSSRVTLDAGPGQSFMSGFVVSAADGGSKKIIVRAVGPTLASFGVANSLKKPVLRLYDANGKPYQNGFVYPAVVGGLTYESDLADSLARAGAFPTPAGSDDAVVMMAFLPGSYTAEVTSGDLTGGMVLLEIYEVP